MTSNNPPGHPPGHPPVGREHDEGPTVRWDFRIGRDLKARAERAAARQRLNASEWLRRLIRRHA